MLKRRLSLTKKLNEKFVNKLFVIFYSAQLYAERCLSYGNFLRQSMLPSFCSSHASIVSQLIA